MHLLPPISIDLDIFSNKGLGVEPSDIGGEEVTKTLVGNARIKEEPQ